MQSDPAAASLYVPLPKPPTARTFTVRKLIAGVQAGAIRVPSFQRPLRWRESDVVTLFDSVLRGYPIGSLMLWKRDFAADDQVRVGSASLRVGPSDGWFIVDGQQRVTALAASLLDLDQKGDPRWEIRFDPSSRLFLAGPASLEGARRQVPLRTLGDLRRLGRWFPDCDLSEDEQHLVEEVQQRILDYEIPAYVVETDDVDALKGVFARLNTTGVRMRADEVFQALLGQEAGPGRPRRGVDLGALQAAADLDGFGEPPRSVVLNALFAMSGLDPGKRLDDVRDEVLGKLVGEDDAMEAIRRAVGFLAAPVDAAEPGAGIPAFPFLPYPAVFVLLVRWFHLFPEPDATARRALSRWLWRAAAKSVHREAPVPAMRVRVDMFEGEDLGGSISRLLDAVGEVPAHEWKLGPFHATRAASRVEILALLDRAPRDVDGLVSWRALPSGDGVARKVFRVSPIADPSLRDLAKTVANRVLLDAHPEELWRELRTWDWGRDQEAAKSHLIDEEGLADLRRKDVSRFLVRRASRLRAMVSAFVTRRAGLGAPRLLPVEAYYDAPGSEAAT